MGEQTGIEWADATWNPVTGCTAVSPGCDRCYAAAIARRFAGSVAYPHGFDITLRPDRIRLPLTPKWQRTARRIFVNSMSDLFHRDVPDTYIAGVFALMRADPAHEFLVLTKRHARMQHLLSAAGFAELVDQAAAELDLTPPPGQAPTWPLPNVSLLVSVENQHWADIRIPLLLATPAAVRGISAEPLLDSITLHPSWIEREPAAAGASRLDWVIVGGETQPGARPMHPDWARGLRDQCAGAGVAFWFKQWGDHRPLTNNDYPPPGPIVTVRAAGEPGEQLMVRVGKKAAGDLLDGRTWRQIPPTRTAA